MAEKAVRALSAETVTITVKPLALFYWAWAILDVNRSRLMMAA
jgi:hypothetical protein